MYDSMTTYKIWAPQGAEWTQWAKPVLFAKQATPVPKQIPLSQGEQKWLNMAGVDMTMPQPLQLPPVDWMRMADPATAIIANLPGEQGVLEGLALAKVGYRPVPLYNGVAASPLVSLVDVRGIVSALFQGAQMLETMPLREDAPPVFLLDANRMTDDKKAPGRYDNRWCVFPQDFPSASYLQTRGIRTVIVSGAMQNDLSHVLRRYQEAGLLVYQVTGFGMQQLDVVKPSRFKGLAYRFSVMAGLQQNPAGGFGGTIPEPTQGGSGSVRYYGHG